MPVKDFLERKIRENPDFHGSLVQSFFHNSIIGQAFTLSSGELIPNQAMCEMFGYTAEEVSVRKWSDLTHPEDIHKSQQLIQAMEAGRTRDAKIVKRYLRKDGSIFWAEAYVAQYTNPENHTTNNLTTIIDITQKVEYEQEAEQMKKTFATFIDASDDKIFLKDENFRYIIVNEAAAKARGRSKEEFILKQMQDFMDEEEAAPKHQAEEEVVQQQKVVITEERSGKRILENRKFPVQLGNGKIGVGGFIRDITEAVHQRELLKKMSESNRIITECMTKEFKNVQAQVDYALSEALRLTESECGVIMLYNESSSEIEMFAHYSQDSICHIKEGSEKRFSLSQLGYWGESIRQRKVLVFEHPTSIEANPAFPFEHRPLKTLMTLPMFERDQIVALVGFANKEAGYSEHDVAAITSLMNGVWMAVNRRMQERRTTRLLKQKEYMFNNHDAVMLLLNADTGKILDVNPAALDFYGYTREEMLQKHGYEINAQGKEVSEKMRKSVLEGKQKRFAAQHTLKSGEIRDVDLFSCAIPDGNETRLFSILFDITEQTKATKQIQYLAYHDHLTGIYNRRYFEETFGLLAKSGEHYPLGVIMGDINGLKLFNDAFGHLHGDTAIQALVQAIQAKLKPEQHLARIGGDEFAILVPSTNEEELKQLIKDLEMLFPQDCTMTEFCSLSISFGYSIQHNKEENLDWLLKESEAFMYNRKYYNSRSFRSSAINAIMETLFAKCEREKVHAEKVSQFSEMIANSLGLDRVIIDKIRVAGMLHDIGKIGIDESILNKPGKLNESEWEIMKLHSAKGAKILSNTVEFHQISEWVLAHHEQIDGHGYPNRLTGDEIPLASKIISVADAYAAMTSPRPYRATMTSDQAVQELKQGAGSKWDTELVDVLLKQVLAGKGD
jgi:diguanylate cyclase (GGDEF)-like protein/PAS domain S-box-containing protein